MLQHSRLVRFRVQESPTQPQNHPLIVFAINEDKCSVKSRDESLVSSLLFCPEPNGQKFVAWNQWHLPHPGGKVKQPKILRMNKWYQMAKPCCFTLNESETSFPWFSWLNCTHHCDTCPGRRRWVISILDWHKLFWFQPIRVYCSLVTMIRRFCDHLFAYNWPKIWSLLSLLDSPNAQYYPQDGTGPWRRRNSGTSVILLDSFSRLICAAASHVLQKSTQGRLDEAEFHVLCIPQSRNYKKLADP